MVEQCFEWCCKLRPDHSNRGEIMGNEWIFSHLEEKVREFANKLLNKIDDLRNKGFNEPISILAFVRNYLIGLTDGIDLAEEMRKLDNE